MLTCRIGSVRVLDASGPGSIPPGLIRFFLISSFLDLFFFLPTENVFHNYQEHRKSFDLKAVRLTKFSFIDHLLSLSKPCWY